MSNIDDELEKLLREQERQNSSIQPTPNAPNNQAFMQQPNFLDPFSIQPRAAQPVRAVRDPPQSMIMSTPIPRQQPPPQQHQIPTSVPLQQPAQTFQLFLQSLPHEQQTLVTDAVRQLQAGQITRQIFFRAMTDTLGNEVFQQLLLAIRSANPAQQQQQQSAHPSAMSPPLSQGSSAMKRKSESQGKMGPPATPQVKMARGTPQQVASTPANSTTAQQKLPPGFLPQQTPAATPSSSSNTSNTQKDVDVTKMDTSSLQDVINYAGVDLKAESELILRDAESLSRGKSKESNQGPYHDESRSQKFIQPVVALSALVRKSAKSAGLSGVDSDCDAMIALATQTFLKGLLEKCAKASRSRVESSRDAWEIELLDGEKAVEGSRVNGEGKRSRIGAVKRPLVWLEKYEKTKESNLAIEYLKGSVSEEGRLAMLDAGIADASGVPPSEDKETGEGKAAATPGETPAPPVEEPKPKKKGKQAAPQSASESYWKDRDDLVIRTRLSNAAALQAVGLDSGSKYSWMTQGAASLGTASSIAADLAASSNDVSSSMPSAPTNSSMGGFGLAKPSQRRKLLATRRITIADLMFVLRNDTARWIRHAYRYRIANKYT